MQKSLQIRVIPEVAATESLLHKHVAETLSVTPKAIKALRIRRRSIDARQRTIFVNLTLDVFLYEAPTEPDQAPTEPAKPQGNNGVKIAAIAGGSAVAVAGIGAYVFLKMKGLIK